METERSFRFLRLDSTIAIVQLAIPIARDILVMTITEVLVLVIVS